MVTTSERQQQRKELLESGYAWDYVDGWPPKTNLYRHAPGLNDNGDVSFPVGYLVKGVPGSPDYVLRKAKIGMFQHPPGDACECRWCIETRASNAGSSTSDSETKVTVPDKEVPVIKGSFPCDECDTVWENPRQLQGHLLNGHPN